MSSTERLDLGMLKNVETEWKGLEASKERANSANSANRFSYFKPNTLHQLAVYIFHHFSIFFLHWLLYWCSDPIYLRLPRVGRKEGSCPQFNTRTAAQRIHKKIHLISSYTYLCFMHASYTFLILRLISSSLSCAVLALAKWASHRSGAKKRSCTWGPCMNSLVFKDVQRCSVYKSTRRLWG